VKEKIKNVMIGFALTFAPVGLAGIVAPIVYEAAKGAAKGAIKGAKKAFK